LIFAKALFISFATKRFIFKTNPLSTAIAVYYHAIERPIFSAANYVHRNY